jgi:peptidyl-prolyl cis-trans isomerase SurA
MRFVFGRALLVASLAASPAFAQEWTPIEEAPKEPAADAAAAAQPGELVEGIAAQVGTEVVLVSEVDRIAQPIETKVREKGGTDADVQLLRSDVLDKLIERKLVLLVAKRAEVEVNEIEIDDTINDIARENQMEVPAMKANVEAEGISWDEYRKRLGEEILQQKVLNGVVRSRAKVDESQIRKLYDQRYGAMPASGGVEVHLLHMAVGSDDGKPASVKAACDKVRRGVGRVRSGENFAVVANEISQAAPDLGWLPQPSLAPWMQSAVANLEPGQASDVIELPVGCAAIALVERREVEALSYEQAKGPLRDVLSEQAFQEEYVRFIDRMRKQTYVERRGEFAEATVDVASPPAIR